MSQKIIYWSAILGVLVFVAESVLGGLQVEGYDPMSQYISESYATGVPYSAYFRYAFISSGLLLAIFAFLAPSLLPKSSVFRWGFFLIAIFYGLNTSITGIFLCDAGCVPDPVNPSISQFIHNLSGSLAYMVTPFCLISIGVVARKWANLKKIVAYSIGCGIGSLAFVVLLFTDPSGPFKGLIQRVIEAILLFWIIYCALQIKRIRN